MIVFDYGFKPTTIIVGDVEFTNLMKEANIFGLGYISIPLNALERTPLKVVLMFNNAQYGRKVMKSFWSWIDASDGNTDALGIDIIDKGDDGYTLCFYQDVNLLMERMVPKGLRDWISPLIMNVCHFKEIDNISEYFTNFKNALKFSKCSIIGGTPRYPFDDFDEIVKSKINVYTLDTIPEDSMIAAYKNKGNMKPRSRKEFVDKQIEKLDDHRTKALKYFFPITYDKLAYRGYLKDTVDSLSEEFKKDLIYQAICNIVLAYRIENDHSLDESIKWEAMTILEYLVDSHESFDSLYPDNGYFTHEVVIDQIKKDADYLNEQLKGE